MSDLARLIPTDIIRSVECHVDGAAIVDVTWTAERIRLDHERANVAREDIELLVMRRATLQAIPMILGNLIEDVVVALRGEEHPLPTAADALQ